MKHSLKFHAALLLPELPAPLPAADIRAGTEAKTIHEAIQRAQPGDTIHLQPIVYPRHRVRRRWHQRARVGGVWGGTKKAARACWMGHDTSEILDNESAHPG